MTAQSDRIKKLLENEDLNDAFDSVANAIHRGWAETPPTELDVQQEWHRRLFTLNSVKENLMSALQDGQYQDFRAVEQEALPPLGDIVSWRKNNQSKKE